MLKDKEKENFGVKEEEKKKLEKEITKEIKEEKEVRDQPNEKKAVDTESISGDEELIASLTNQLAEKDKIIAGLVNKINQYRNLFGVKGSDIKEKKEEWEKLLEKKGKKLTGNFDEET